MKRFDWAAGNNTSLHGYPIGTVFHSLKCEKDDYPPIMLFKEKFWKVLLLNDGKRSHLNRGLRGSTMSLSNEYVENKKMFESDLVEIFPDEYEDCQ